MKAFGVRDAVLAGVMVLIWGSNYAIAKLGLHQVPPFLFMAARFALTAAMLACFVPVRRPPWLAIGVYASVVGLVHFGSIFYALRYTDAATVIILSQISVPLTAILGAGVLGEALTVRQGLGILVAVGGIAIAAGGPSLDVGLGIAAVIFLGALAWAVGTIWMKAKLSIPSSQVNLWITVLAAPMLLTASVLTGEYPLKVMAELTPLSGIILLYQAIFIMIIGYGIWNFLVSKYEVRLVSPITLLVPPTGLLFAFVILDEALSAYQAAGAAFTMIGVSLIVMPSTWLSRKSWGRREAT